MRDRAHVVVLTGAGISADSGVATFRGAGGLWEGHRIEDVATPRAWRRDPNLVWRFYQLRRAQLARVDPNPAHAALSTLEAELASRGHGYFLITQNVDNLHERAGSTATHMHGELSKLRCEACDAVVEDLARLEPDSFIPCKNCENDRLRPDIVWFGEVPYHMDLIFKNLERATHFLSIGTSGVVYPAAGFLAQARASGARTIVNSLDEPDNLDPADRFLPGRAAETVPALVKEFLRSFS